MTEFKVVDTNKLQELSLTTFMAAVGYDAVYDPQGKLVSFKQPKFRITGQETVSVNTAILLHNHGGDNAWDYISTQGPASTLINYLKYADGETDIIMLFATTTKIIQMFKGTYSKKRGLEFPNEHAHKVKFMTHYDYVRYKHLFKE